MSELHKIGQKFTFVLADAEEVRSAGEAIQAVNVVTDMVRRCSKCGARVLAEPLSMSLSNVVDHKGLHDAQWAVATALFNAEEAMQCGAQFADLPYDRQTWWMRQVAAEGWEAATFVLEKIAPGLKESVRAAGIAEARKWPAFTDRRKVFRVSGAQFPPGWVHLSFEAHSSTDGRPVRYGNVGVHVCPECAPAVFAAAGIVPTDPFGNGAKW
jgi:ribosomal protein S27AE